MLTRKQYLALTKLDSDNHTALKGRDMIPFPSAGRNEYDLRDAFTLILANEGFAGGLAMNRTMAAEIVRDCGSLLIEALDKIEAGSHPDSETLIFAGRIARQGGKAPFVGTAAELADALVHGAGDVHGGRAMDVAVVNVCLAYAVLRTRCERAGIDISELWNG